MVRTDESCRIAFGALESGPGNAALTVGRLAAFNGTLHHRRVYSEQCLHHLRRGKHCIVRFEESLLRRQVPGNTGTIRYAPELALIKLRQVARGHKPHSWTRFGVLGITHQNAVTALGLLLGAARRFLPLAALRVR